MGGDRVWQGGWPRRVMHTSRAHTCVPAAHLYTLVPGCMLGVNLGSAGQAPPPPPLRTALLGPQPHCPATASDVCWACSDLSLLIWAVGWSLVCAQTPPCPVLSVGTQRPLQPS